MKKPILALAVAAALVPSLAAAATFTVTTTATSGAGSLAQAITDANATDVADTIAFNIAGGGVKTIAGVLPAITKPLEINGYTQPGATANSDLSGSTNAVLTIFLDGTGVSSGSAVLRVNTSSTTIRGLAVGGIKSGVAGIEVATSVTATIKGCFIGTNAAGNGDSSAGTGVVVRGTADIGGELLGDRNLVSGNSTAGIVLRGPNSFVRGNLIGTNAAGDPVLGNGRGLQVTGSAATGNTVGDFGLTAPNRIAGNTGDGILVSADAGSGNSLDRNLIHDNGGLSIDLGGDGPTRNDATDADEGPNHLLNAPEIGLARINGNKLTAELVMRTPPGSYRVSLFVSPSPGPDGFGEGPGTVTGTVVTMGSSPFRVHVTSTLDDTPADSLWLSAVATQLTDESSSEFSRATEAVQAGSTISVTSTADSDAGSLRAAIAEADFDPDPNTITFAIPGNGPHVIALQSSLWVNDNPVLVDGYSQAGSLVNALQSGTDAKPGIVLDGAAIASGPVFGSFQAPVILRGLTVLNGPEDGILLSRAAGSAVEGCFAGVDASHDAGSGNTLFGVHSSETNNVRIGGPFVGERNLLAGNGAGLRVNGVFSRVFNNILGNFVAPNLVVGLTTGGQGSIVGDDDPDFYNSIVGNGEDGIHVAQESQGNDIRGNIIYDNGGLGINLADGHATPVTPNDANDADSGGNGLQNFPVLTSATSDPGVLTVEGTLDVPVNRLNTAYRLRLYRNETCDPSGHGEGEELLWSTDVFVGNAETFTAILPLQVSNTFLSATITDPETGNTSEFSACQDVTLGSVLCGDANLDQKILSADALLVLRTAVGTDSCVACACDVNASATITASDALLVLKKAVGQGVNLACPGCG